MGFSGGGTNVLKPHKHSSAVQDGSPLNMNNVTEATLSAGDVIYSDGSALQRLSYPGVPAGESLTAAALSSAPSWASASGAVFDKIAEQTTPGTSIDTGALSACDNYTRLLFMFTFENDDNVPLDIQWYDNTGALITSYYQLFGFTNSAFFNLSPNVASLQLSNSLNVGTEGCGGFVELYNRRMIGGYGAIGRASWVGTGDGGTCSFLNKGYDNLNGVAVQGFSMLSPVTFDNALWVLYGST